MSCLQRCSASAHHHVLPATALSLRTSSCLACNGAQPPHIIMSCLQWRSASAHHHVLPATALSLRTSSCLACNGDQPPHIIMSCLQRCSAYAHHHVLPATALSLRTSSCFACNGAHVLPATALSLRTSSCFACNGAQPPHIIMPCLQRRSASAHHLRSLSVKFLLPCRPVHHFIQTQNVHVPSVCILALCL